MKKWGKWKNYYQSFCRR